MIYEIKKIMRGDLYELPFNKIADRLRDIMALL